MKNKLVKMICSTLAVGFLGMPSVQAADEMMEYSLGEVIVTAQRYEKRDIDVAASTEILTEADLRNTGASNLYDALRFSTGLEMQQYGTAGSSMGNMTSKVAIRGNNGGTLVLVNGMPLNIRGTYDLNDIQVDDIERVEIVRGGGSVLYGSEATGGVINIITKKKRSNYFKTGWGNYGQQEHTLSLQADKKLGIGYQYSEWGKRNNVDSEGRKWIGPENNNLSLSYAFNDKLDFSYNRIESQYHYVTIKDSGKAKASDTKQDVERNNAQLSYQEDDFKATLYYVDRSRERDAIETIAKIRSIDEEKNKNYGLDMQKAWDITAGKVLFGGTFKREEYIPDTKGTIVERENQTRNNFSAYTQYEKRASALNTWIISARESWTTGAPNAHNNTNFSGQAQFVHKMTDNENLYASVGESYKMPDLHQIWKSGVKKLEPQTGRHYELGWKKNSGIHNWRVAVFNYNIDDNISATFNSKKNDFEYKNENLKNTGIELECTIKPSQNPFGYRYAVSYGNPKTENIDAAGVSLGWQPNFSRWEVKGGITYQQDKWQAAMNASYMADRVLSGIDKKPYLLTNLNVNYAMTKDRSLFLTINNLLDREDVSYASTSADYYFAPINYMIGYKMTF